MSGILSYQEFTSNATRNPTEDPSYNNVQQASSAGSPDYIGDKDVPKVLARNSACHQCRKRKLKCDAIKPICANCQKPRQRGTGKGDNVAEVDSCTWDEPKEPSARTRRRRESAKRQALASANELKPEEELEVSVKKAKLNALEHRIAACHSVLEGQKQGMSQVHVDVPGGMGIRMYNPSDSASSLPRPASNIPTDQSYFYPNPPVNLQYPQNTAAYSQGVSVPSAGNTIYPDMASANQYANLSALYDDNSTFTSPSKDLLNNQVKPEAKISPAYENPSPMDPLSGLFDIVWPDWPKDLPKYEVVEHIVRAFFEKVPTLPKMLNKNQLLQNLMMPPSHYSFPARPLLHAILAITSNFISESTLATRAYFPVGTRSTEFTHPTNDFDGPASKEYFNFTSHSSSQRPNASTPLSRFQLWHRRKAFEMFSVNLDKGDKYLQGLQAYIIATVVDQYNAWWTDLWMETGACMRMATPLRLNESPNTPTATIRRGAMALIGPARNGQEQAERDRTWWMAYILERGATASTAWPSSLSEDEITVELPVLQSTYDSGYGQLTGVQSLLSADLYTSHPPCHRDSFCFLVKSMKIFTEVQIFLRQYSRGLHSIAGYLSQPTFRLLLSQINTFRISFPPEFRRPTQAKFDQGMEALDRDLITSLWILHGASVCLGEPLVTKDTWTHEGARMTLAAIRASLSLLYDLTASSYDLTLFSPHCSFSWCLASRGLVRFVDAAAESGDRVSASVFRSEVEVFRLALQRFGERFPVAVKHGKMVEDLLAQLNNMTLGTKPYSVLYDCSIEDVIKDGRPVGAGISSEASSQTMFTSSGMSGTSGTSGITALSPEDQSSINTNLPKYDQESQPQIQNLPQGDTKNSNDFVGTGIAPPLMMDMEFQDSWDISNFSFDVNAVVSMFESNGAVFDGSLFNMPTQ